MNHRLFGCHLLPPNGSIDTNCLGEWGLGKLEHKLCDERGGTLSDAASTTALERAGTATRLPAIESDGSVELITEVAVGARAPGSNLEAMKYLQKSSPPQINKHN